MRKFSLVNANGQSWDMTEANRTFLFNVSGLGYKRDTIYARISTRFANTSDQLEQQDIVGTVLFGKQGSAQTYFDFIKFLQDTPLRLEYDPGIGVHFRNGMVVAVEKTDSGEGALRSWVTFRCTTPWIRSTVVFSDKTKSNGKEYNYKYNYVYSDFAKNTVSFISDTMIASPAKLRIYGPVTNPVWRHYVNGELVSTGGVNATIDAGRELVVDSTSPPYTIEQYDGFGRRVSDLYQQSDFATKRFIEIRHGTNTITVAGDSADDISLKVEAQLEYVSI